MESVRASLKPDIEIDEANDAGHGHYSPKNISLATQGHRMTRMELTGEGGGFDFLVSTPPFACVDRDELMGDVGRRSPVSIIHTTIGIAGRPRPWLV